MAGFEENEYEGEGTLEEALERSVTEGFLTSRTDPATGEEFFSSTDQGDAKVVELLGGPRAVHFGHALAKIIEDSGTALGPITPEQKESFGMWTWLVTARCAQVIEWALTRRGQGGNAAWLIIGHDLEEELERLEPKYFEHRGRAFP